MDATRKRLRKLADCHYVTAVQPNRMHQALFRLGPEGKRWLERAQGVEVVVPRQPPKQLEHFLGANDLRIAAELGFKLSFFYSYWELPAIGWKQPIIPDAVFGIDRQAFAVELTAVRRT